jgi:hypothetical protein
MFADTTDRFGMVINQDIAVGVGVGTMYNFQGYARVAEKVGEGCEITYLTVSNGKVTVASVAVESTSWL